MIAEAPELGARCFLCKQPIAVGEPFLTALVFGRRGELGHRAFHFTCHSRETAQLIVDALAPHLQRRHGGADDNEGELADLVAAVIARMG